MEQLVQAYEQLLVDIKEQKENEIDLLTGFIEEAEAYLKKEHKRFYSVNHISEFYLAQYYLKIGADQLLPFNLGGVYYCLGQAYEKEKKYVKAKSAYEKAYDKNPTDIENLNRLIEMEKVREKLNLVHQYTIKGFPYCLTRATLARYYRNLGFYYLEKYEPKVAEALYTYSNLFYETENARNELKYLAEALKRETPVYTIPELQEILSDKKIPLQAESKSLALLYQVGCKEAEAGRSQNAIDCFMMVYDLTQDKEVLEQIHNLQNK